MTAPVVYDVAIVGGGLAGLSLAIRLKKLGHDVILIEKEQYPFHKVCGEYISLESWNFLKGLGADPAAMAVPIIRHLEISSAGGKLLRHTLPLGGFGISRFRLDHELVQLAKAAGVVVMENTKVNDIMCKEDECIIQCSGQQYLAKIACACYGKRSNMDIKWKRPFALAPKNKINNYVGVKYHIKANLPADSILLHHFKNGYCGIVKIEDNRYNLCYLTRADNLQQCGGDIASMERKVLSRNPHLKKILEQSEKLSAAPLTISQISFDKKSQVHDHILMIGDAAGMITPLCGNGMSMALHGSKIAAACIHDFLLGNINRTQLEARYTGEWKQQFARRLSTGRFIQRLFGSRWVSGLFISVMRPFPQLVNWLVRKTHGEEF